jgi:hypothetical protein
MPKIPTTWEAESSRIIVQDQHNQKVSETLAQRTSQTRWFIPVISATPRGGGRITV